tara:strand:+ start:121 stop:477 length:357 start_codon:yes stop_codon:yes gene_type:complete
MTQVTLLKDFTKAIVSINGEDIDVEELGDLPLSIVVNGKVRNIEKIELRKYIFTVPDDSGQNMPRPLVSLVCIPQLPDGEPFLRNQESGDSPSDEELSDPAQVKLRGFNYEVLKEIYL